jgi:hypothetical protein
MGKTSVFSDSFAEIEIPWVGSEARELWLKTTPPPVRPILLVFFSYFLLFFFQKITRPSFDF